MAQPTISTVAALAGVSVATVSRFLNRPESLSAKTRERVGQAIDTLDYSPNIMAQSFRRGRSNIIMVVMPRVGCSFLGDVLTGIREGISERYSIVVAEANLRHQSYDEVGAMLLSRQVDGLVLLATVPPFGTKLEEIGRGNRLPVVIGCEAISSELEQLPSVHIDNFAAAYEATRHLIDLGHRRIAFIAGPSQSLLTRDRERGFRQAMAHADLPVEAGQVVSAPVNNDGGAQAAMHLIGSDVRPTAIFCANDELALGVLHALQQAGVRVPADMSVLGFDDIRYAAIASPALSTVAQPANEIGRRVAARLIAAIEGGAADGPATEIVAHRLMIRQSTGPAPRADRPQSRECQAAAPV